jgi:hypothetical protein
MSIQFDRPNDPNAARLIESLRCLGYDNYVAIADVVDNCFDADASTIKIRVWTEERQFRLAIGDDGIGMNQDVLDEALRLGSLTAKDPVSDIGKFGMGLVTAGLSLARQTKVITHQGDAYLTSIVDVDVVKQENAFCKFLGESTDEDKALIDREFPDSESATIVLFDRCDGVRNTNTSVFAKTLAKHLGRIHRYFLKAEKSILINGEPVRVVDPLELDDEDTEIFSDEEYPVTVKVGGEERREDIRIRIALIPRDAAGGDRDIAIGLRNQGFYLLRNEREIRSADTLDAFTKHNDFNRMRGEVFFTGELDNIVGIDFTKRDIVLEQSLKDQLLKYLAPQCSTIKGRESRRTARKESDDIEFLHRQAERYIGKKSKLLVMPKGKIEKRGRRASGKGVGTGGAGRGSRKNLKKTQQADATRCRFEGAALGPHGQVYECDQEGRTVVIRWNIEHPFYQRFVIDQRSDGRLVTAIDYLVYSMAVAELSTFHDENCDLLNGFKAIVSSNVRTLLA